MLPNFRQTDSHFRGDAGFAVDDLGESLPADAENLRPGGHRQAQRLEAIMPDDAAGMDGVLHGHGPQPIASTIACTIDLKPIW